MGKKEDIAKANELKELQFIDDKFGLAPKDAELGEIAEPALRVLDPLLRKMASGKHLTPDEHNKILACPNIIKAMGHEYVLETPNMTFDTSRSLAFSIPLYENKRTSQQDVDKTLKQIFDGELKPLPTPLSKVEESLEAAANPKDFINTTPLLRTLVENPNKIPLETNRCNGKEGLQGVLTKPPYELAAAAEFSENLFKEYKLISAIATSPEKSYIGTMLSCGNLKGPDGQPLMEDYKKLYELHINAKKLFQENPQDVKAGAQVFMARHEKELEDLQEDFLKIVKKHAEVPITEFSMCPANTRERTLAGLKHFEKMEQERIAAKQITVDTQQTLTSDLHKELDNAVKAMEEFCPTIVENREQHSRLMRSAPVTEAQKKAFLEKRATETAKQITETGTETTKVIKRIKPVVKKRGNTDREAKMRFTN